MADLANTLLETIEYALDKTLPQAEFDRTFICTVTNINGNTLTLSHGNETYTVTTRNSLDIKEFDQVHLKFPSNNKVDKYIEEDINSAGGGSSSSTVRSVAGKTGVVVLEIADIVGLQERLDAISAGRQILMDATMPTTQVSGDIWWELEEYYDASTHTVTTY